MTKTYYEDSRDLETFSAMLKKHLGGDIEMKSVQSNRYGGSEVVEINQNRPESKVSAGKVLVNVGQLG